LCLRRRPDDAAVYVEQALATPRWAITGATLAGLDTAVRLRPVDARALRTRGA